MSYLEYNVKHVPSGPRKIFYLNWPLAILLAIIALVLSADPVTFDMRALIAMQPLAGMDLRGGLILLGFVLGFAVKTPLFPLHTWLPPAHVNAPGPASAILAGVLLKMGTYGLIRIPFQMLREAFAAWSLPIALLALASILWGSIVAFAQTDMKRRIAYTSVNHMGYAVLGIAAAGALLTGSEGARSFALTGAVQVWHILAGGFLVIDDFWGSWEWGNFERQIRHVLPEFSIVEIPLDHPLFTTFYNIGEIVQVPNIRRAQGGPTWQRDGVTPHVRGIFDEQGRLMVMINWNTDIGDAWEWAESPYYPLRYSTYAIEITVNAIVYAMSH